MTKKRVARWALARRYPWDAPVGRGGASPTLRARLSVLLLMGLAPLLSAASLPGAAPQPAVPYVIVVTGGELLEGAYADGHTQFITRTLRPLGLRCVGSMCVDDKQADLKEALRFATGKAPIVIVTGGLGPTDNDITRETLSDFTGIELREHRDVLEAMTRRFRVPPDKLRTNLRRQTRVPARGTYLKNSNGTAVGLVFEPDDAVIVALPGPPRELQPMVRDELVPYLSRRFGTRLPGCSLTLRFVGLGQSQIDQTLKDHVPLPGDVTVSSQFEAGRVDFTFTLPDDTPKDRERLRALGDKIKEHLDDHLYAEGETSLEQCVVDLLASRGQTLALAEAGSGGSLAAALSSADDAPAVLAGAYVAPTAEGLRRLLGVPDDQWPRGPSPRQKTESLAVVTAGAAASQWAVAVGEPLRDESGAAQIQVTIRSPDGQLDSRQVRLYGTDELARSRLCTQLLDLLRRRLK